jgi:hypothetical protein
VALFALYPPLLYPNVDIERRSAISWHSNAGTRNGRRDDVVEVGDLRDAQYGPATPCTACIRLNTRKRQSGISVPIWPFSDKIENPLKHREAVLHIETRLTATYSDANQVSPLHADR